MMKGWRRAVLEQLEEHHHQQQWLLEWNKRKEGHMEQLMELMATLAETSQHLQ